MPSSTKDTCHKYSCLETSLSRHSQPGSAQRDGDISVQDRQDNQQVPCQGVTLSASREVHREQTVWCKKPRRQSEGPQTLQPLPSHAARVWCSNNLGIEAAHVLGCSRYQGGTRGDTAVIQQWLCCTRGTTSWGHILYLCVNPCQKPSHLTRVFTEERFCLWGNKHLLVHADFITAGKGANGKCHSWANREHPGSSCLQLATRSIFCSGLKPSMHMG